MRCSCCENLRRPNYYVNLLTKFLDKCVSKLITLEFFVCSFTILLWTAPVLVWYKTGFFGLLLLFAIAINILRVLYVAIVAPVAKENSSNLQTETPTFDLKGAFDKLVEQNEVITKQFEKLIEENRGLKKDLENFGSERVAYNNRRDEDMNFIRKYLEEEKENLRQEVAYNTGRGEDIDFIRKYLEEEKVNLPKEIEEAENELGDELDKNEHLEDVVSKLREEKEKLEENLEEEKMTNQRLKEKYKKILERHERETQNMTNEEMVAEISRVTKLDIANFVRKYLENENVSLRKEIEDCENKLKVELNEKEHLIGVVCELEEEKEKLKEDLEEEKMRNQRLEEKNKKILERHEMKNEEIVEILRVTKMDIASNIGCLSSELGQVRGLIEKTSDKLGKMKVQGVEENYEMMDKMNSLEENYGDLSEDYQSLTSKVATLANGVRHVQDLVKLFNEQKATNEVNCEKLLAKQDNLFEFLKEKMPKIKDDTSEDDGFELLDEIK